MSSTVYLDAEKQAALSPSSSSEFELRTSLASENEDLEALKPVDASWKDPPPSPLEYSVPLRTKFLALGMYFLLNLSLTIHSKVLLGRFAFPYLLTTIHTGVTALGCYVLMLRGHITLTRQSTKDNLILVAFSTLFTINIAISNVSFFGRFPPDCAVNGAHFHLHHLSPVLAPLLLGPNLSDLYSHHPGRLPRHLWRLLLHPPWVFADRARDGARGRQDGHLEPADDGQPGAAGARDITAHDAAGRFAVTALRASDGRDPPVLRTGGRGAVLPHAGLCDLLQRLHCLSAERVVVPHQQGGGCADDLGVCQCQAGGDGAARDLGVRCAGGDAEWSGDGDYADWGRLVQQGGVE
ncbi:hypothetical protein BP6252_07467 [Coleophoma cylindrospora]|uniref:Sugar phosphate transporter domain-containing protein n=1 Tax=Coleophoma cylindrospora TaxID=1849047 RepID=A0A3D8RHW2_9HELO|nr:hypothetical protein BP6252_07467 [Coleophoma cylindrospora]